MSIASRDLQTLFSVGTLGGLPDGRLLERFAAHREEASFEAIVRRHGPMVWGVCRRILLFALIDLAFSAVWYATP